MHSLWQWDATVGMHALFSPDFPHRYDDMARNRVINHAYNLASYSLENNNPIQDRAKREMV